MTAAIHSAETLRYFLLEGRPRLEPLRVFESRRVEWQRRVVTLCALGTSHAVLVELGNTALTELLTCAAGDLEARVLEQRAASSACVISRTIDVLRYDCRLSPFALDGGDRLRGAFSSADQITFTYGVDHGAEEPMTRIGWRADDATLVVETLHTYPHEGRGVRSESTFRILTALKSENARGVRSQQSGVRKKPEGFATFCFRRMPPAGAAASGGKSSEPCYLIP